MALASQSGPDGLSTLRLFKINIISNAMALLVLLAKTIWPISPAVGHVVLYYPKEAPFD